MFNSYEAGRTGYVTLIANYQPFENPQGGPNYYTMDPNALYEISIDNTGSGKEALTFQFRFTTVDCRPRRSRRERKSIPVPLSNIGRGHRQQHERPECRGDLYRHAGDAVTAAAARRIRRGRNHRSRKTFTKPLDNIGAKSIANYAAYAGSVHPQHHDSRLQHCRARCSSASARIRFVVNLGETFDLVNIKYPVEELAPAGMNARNLAPNSLAGYNVTSIALEIPSSCLTAGSDPVIGAWTTASMRQSAVINPQPQSAKSVSERRAPSPHPPAPSVEGGAWTQVSRLGMPLVNELVIGLPDKDRFNASAPKDDAQFADYVTNPSLPVLLQALFGSAGCSHPMSTRARDLVGGLPHGYQGPEPAAKSDAPPRNCA